jgi:sec-independent protein translocase protein TatC
VGDTLAETRELSFFGHLMELRARLVRIAAALLIGFIAAWNWRIELFSALTAPVWHVLQRHGISHLRVLDVTEPIAIYMNVSLIAAVTLTSPYTFSQVWAFIAPGLYRRERRAVLAVVGPSVLFFVLGLLFAYWVMIPFSVEFLIGLGLENPEIAVELTVANTIRFELTFLLLFALVFELPLVMAFLAALDLVGYQAYGRFFRYWIVAAFVIGAILTPPDVVSQVLLSIPLILLYLLGVLAAWVIHVRRAGRGAVALKSMARFGLLAVALLVPAYWWGVRPMLTPAHKAAELRTLVWRVEPAPDAPESPPAPTWILRAAYADGFEAVTGAPVPLGEFQPRGHDPASALALVERLGCDGTCLWGGDGDAFGQRYLGGTGAWLPPLHDPRFTVREEREGGGCDVSLYFSVPGREPWLTWLVGDALARHWHERFLSGGRAWPWQDPMRAGPVTSNSGLLATRLPYTPCDDVLKLLYGQ